MACRSAGFLSNTPSNKPHPDPQQYTEYLLSEGTPMATNESPPNLNHSISEAATLCERASQLESHLRTLHCEALQLVQGAIALSAALLTLSTDGADRPRTGPGPPTDGFPGHG